MDELEVLKATLNNTLIRSSKLMQDYEVQIANMTAEIIRLQMELQQKEDKPSKAPASKS